MSFLNKRRVDNIVSTHKTSTWTSAANLNFQDVTGLSVSITPTRSTSKILITATVHASTSYTGASLFNGQVWRGSSATILPFIAASTQQSGNTNWCLLQIQYLDSPATTSSTTYQFQISNTNGSTSTYYVNRRGDSATVLATSSITATEVFV